jgi:uncharacterized protein (DUF2249 family)
MSTTTSSKHTSTCCSGTAATPASADTVKTALTNALVKGNLDVRSLPPAQRHSLIFETYHRLGQGESFVLVNDHDPKPLYYQFDAEHNGEFTWAYEEQGPEAWRVRIGKTKNSNLDVRSLPPARRHSLIFETYHGLGVGESFVLINDHDPKPLYYQFEAEHNGEFTWAYEEQGPEVWRVRIGRTKKS